jgi:hypothetical protein
MAGNQHFSFDCRVPLVSRFTSPAVTERKFLMKHAGRPHMRRDSNRQWNCLMSFLKNPLPLAPRAYFASSSGCALSADSMWRSSHSRRASQPHRRWRRSGRKSGSASAFVSLRGLRAGEQIRRHSQTTSAADRKLTS